jgi:hypothetical protein
MVLYVFKYLEIGIEGHECLLKEFSDHLVYLMFFFLVKGRVNVKV